MTLYADIAFRRRIPQSNDGLFTFKVPEKLYDKIERGCVVEAPLQKNIERAVVIKIHHNQPAFHTEKINKVCTPVLLEEKQLQIAKRVAKKTYSPLARVIPLFLPKKIFEGTGTMPKIQILSVNTNFVKNGRDHSSEKKLGTKMQTVVEILEGKNTEERLRLQKKSNCTKATIDKMLEKEILQEEWKNVFEAEEITPKKIPLNDEQKTVFDALLQKKKSLLFAPTGSGKSYTIRQAAAEVVQKGKTALLMVPEIGLTDELMKKCKEIFGAKHIALFHSRLSEGERATNFWKIKSGQAKVIIGSRISAFLPFQKLGFVAVEEEHEWTLKSEKSPRFHGRDVAEFLAEIYDCPLVFASATPSLETYCRSLPSPSKKKREIPLFSLSSRFSPPKITIVNMNEESQAKNFSPLSHTLIRAIETNIKKKNQVLLLLNRRGMFRVLVCKQCGEITRCPECNIAMTTHNKNGKTFLLCHHCGKVFGMPKRCKVCQSAEMENRGSGTANIEHILHAKFPNEKIVRIDRDTTTGKKDFENLYEDFSAAESGIIIGTQMIAKGIDFSRIGLVGIINADEGLHIPDFRAQEKTYALLAQACGRAGRRGQESQAIIQTRMPDLALFSFLQNMDTKGFLETEKKQREKFGLPPTKKMIKLIFAHSQKEVVFANARKTQKLLEQSAKKMFPEEKILISVAPALQPFRQKKFFVNVLISAKKPEKILKHTHISGCKIDVDPIDTVG